MNDIVQRLRSYAAGWHRCPSGPPGWLNFPKHYEEAAAEIETLRAQLAAAESHLLTLAEECRGTRTAVEQRGDGIMLPASCATKDNAIGSVRIRKMLDARAATDAAGSLAFAAGLKERKETSNAE